MDSKKIIAKHKRALEAWLANPRNDRTEATRKELRKWLASTAPRAPAVAALQLTHLGRWIGAQATAQILNGDPAGWEGMNRVLHYNALNVEVDPRGLVNEIALPILHALAFEEFSLASRLGAILLLAQSDPRVVGWPVSPLPRFALRLSELAEQRPPSALTALGRDAPAIAALFAAWNDPVRLTTALHGVCDWHLRESLEIEGYPAFESSPYELFAVDVLAVVSVRRRLGLATTLPSHPLLDLPLARPPLPMPALHDEGLELVRARNARTPVPEAARYHERLAAPEGEAEVWREAARANAAGDVQRDLVPTGGAADTTVAEATVGDPIAEPSAEEPSLRSPLVPDLAPFLGAHGAFVARAVSLAVRSPHEYVAQHAARLRLRGIVAPTEVLPLVAFLDALLERRITVEIDWRESPWRVDAALRTLRVVPTDRAVSDLVSDDGDPDDAGSVLGVLRVVEAQLAERGVTLLVLDLQNDSFTVLAVEAAVEAAFRAAVEPYFGATRPSLLRE